MNIFEKQYSNSSQYTVRIIRTVMRFIGMKKNTEQNMVRNKFKKVPDMLSSGMQRSCAIDVGIFSGKTVWTIQSKAILGALGDSSTAPVLLYFHGGAFLEGVTKRHWLFLNKLAQAWSGTIVFPDYPLAPEHGYRDIQNFALALCHNVVAQYPNSNIIVMGDSAGGGLALSIALQLREQGAKLPQALVLYSPWLDLSMNNPQLAELERVDEILSVQGLKAAAAYYAQGAPLNDWLLSPLYGSFHNLCPIVLFTGTHDLLYADAVRFKERFRETAYNTQPQTEAISGEHSQHGTEQTYSNLLFYEYRDMFHDWMLVPALPEAHDVITKTIAFCNNIVS